jgi:hypothetical protein
MDQSKLSNIQKTLEKLAAKKGTTQKSNYLAPKKVKDESMSPLDDQKIKHRWILLGLIGFLSCASFIFLVCIIAFQMKVRLTNPSYNGVSDTVVNIVAVSVFAQVIAVVATISKLVFKDGK